jgi:hypothetical protein
MLHFVAVPKKLLYKPATGNNALLFFVSSMFSFSDEEMAESADLSPDWLGHWLLSTSDTEAELMNVQFR